VSGKEREKESDRAASRGSKERELELTMVSPGVHSAGSERS